MVGIEGISKAFGRTPAVDRVDLDIRAGELFALLGPSGCGKTTLLRMIAGFEQPDAGTIRIDGEDMTRIPPNRRPVNMVFQSYAVFPHMDVARNVGYGLRVTGVGREETRRRVEEALAMVRLDGLGARRPDQLSGGQRQRVALARALVKRPKVLLLDEPLSALDRKLREDMRLELVRLQAEVGITFVIVTHDQEEALSMADRIAVMHEGRILQTAPPREVYETPASRFVAGFIGSMNIVPARVVTDDHGGIRLEAAAFGSLTLPAARAPADGVALGVRPEKVRLARDEPDGLARAPGRITRISYFGDHAQVHVALDGGLRVVAMRLAHGHDLVVGDRLWVAFDPTDGLLLEE
jgi:spermidine/putrescine ABC transporter ATP-binding subunit